MKIAWFTPLSDSSGVSKFSKTLLDELTNHLDVDVWAATDQHGEADEKAFSKCNFIYFSSSRAEEYLPALKAYDVIVYNLGNNVQYHAEIYRMYEKFSGVIILHDFVMQHFMLEYHTLNTVEYYKKFDKKPPNVYKSITKPHKIIKQSLRSIWKDFNRNQTRTIQSLPHSHHRTCRKQKNTFYYLIEQLICPSKHMDYLEDYFEVSRSCYGLLYNLKFRAFVIREGIRKNKDVVGAYLRSSEIMKYPLFEAACHNASGVIVHSEFFHKIVNTSINIPSVKISFPPPKLQSLKEVDIPNHKNKTTILSFGHIVPNKKIYEVVKVIGENPEIKNNVVYNIIGNYNESYFSEIQGLIEKFALEKVVNFIGFQEDVVLFSYLKKSDVIINLRHPITEGASWSLVEQMLLQKAIIVTNAGFYSEIPESCLLKIEPGEEQSQLKKCLVMLIKNKSLREELGQNACNHAKDKFSTKRYCESLKEFLYKIERRYCQVCGSETHEHIQRKSFIYNKCNHCGFISTDRKSTEMCDAKFYQSADYAAEEDSWPKEERINLFKMLLHLAVQGSCEEWPKVLDFGAGIKDLQEKSALYKHLVFYDVSFSHPLLTKKTKIDGTKFDALICTEVIEHVSDQIEFFKQMNSLLKIGSICYATTLLHDYRFNLVYLDPDVGHISIHSKKSLKHVAKAAGFNHKIEYSDNGENYYHMFIKEREADHASAK